MDIEAGKERQQQEKFEMVYKPLTDVVSEPQLLKSNEAIRKKSHCYLYLSSLTADLVMFNCGCNFTWTSPVMSTLRSSNVDINPLGSPVTPVQESWIVALNHLGAAVGPIAFGKLADVLGRKKLLSMVVLLKIISYVILAFASNVYLFYLGRFLLGVGIGLSFAIMPMYTGEISENHNRGKLTSIMGTSMCLGYTYPLIVGPLLSLKVFSLSCTIALILVVIGFSTFIPESPVFLVSKGKRSQALKALMKLRNINFDLAEKEVTKLKLMLAEENANKSKLTEIFKTPSLRKGVMICMGVCSLQHLSGDSAILAFIGPIFEITGSQIPPHFSVILVALIQFLSNLISSFTIDKWGRKPLLLSSTSIIFVSLFCLGLYFYLKECGSQYLHSLFWLPITSLMLYNIAFSFGLAAVPGALQSEMFSSNVRSTASSVVTCFGAIAGFAVTFIFPIMMFYLGPAKCFWLFGIFTFCGIVFVYFVIPETKGKSIAEIQKLLSKSRK